MSRWQPRFGGRCRRCGTTYFLDEPSLCARCIGARESARAERNRRKVEMRRKRKAEGRCYDCPRAAVSGRTLCAKCARRKRRK